MTQTLWLLCRSVRSHWYQSETDLRSISVRFVKMFTLEMYSIASITVRVRVFTLRPFLSSIWDRSNLLVWTGPLKIGLPRDGSTLENMMVHIFLVGNVEVIVPVWPCTYPLTLPGTYALTLSRWELSLSRVKSCGVNQSKIIQVSCLVSISS